MREAADRGKAFVNLGHTGTPARDAGIPAFLADTNNWAQRAQQALDAHAATPRYVTRMFQRFIDDRQAYASSVRPGPEIEADAAAWNDSLVAASGPYQVCGDLGIPLW
jgi:ribosomal protein L16 Arg81 hydroxylase